jgi:large subunit ribosomal protein L37Ae
MAQQKKRGFATTFGVRYGRTNREKFDRVRRQHRGKHTCPYCQYAQVKRTAVGIWHCAKCGTTFASQAYKVATPASLTKEEEDV